MKIKKIGNPFRSFKEKVKDVWARNNRIHPEPVAPVDPVIARRNIITELFVHGDGIEIGALHNPLQVPLNAHVKYVDRMPVNELKQQYPELGSLKLVHVDIVDDGEVLRTIKDSSQDFVIANHFIEHCQNPIQALQNMLRVLRSGGILYFAVPDKRFTFDIDRPVTPFSHIEFDYLHGPEGTRKQHFEEWSRFVNKTIGDDAVQDEVAHLMKIDYSIHFHVWTQTEILEFIIQSKKYLSFGIEMIHQNHHEVICVLTKE